MSHDGSDWNVSMIAWGEPSDPRAFSGNSASLRAALQRRGALRGEFSAKHVRWFDALRGALSMKTRRGKLPTPFISRAWMWSEKGQETLSRRFGKMLRQSGDHGPMLQVGTLVEIPPDLGPHYMLTDMTIPQARRERMFDVGRLTAREIDEAIRVQHRVLHTAEHLFVPSQWCRDSMIDDFDIHPDKVSIVYAGSNLALPANLAVPRREHDVLFVGIDWQRKGGPLLIDAFRLVRKQLPDATLHIVGCSPDVKEPGVFVEGFLNKCAPRDHERLSKLYMQASCFCLPSLFDPFPIVIVEAASAGLASVGIDTGSRCEAIVDGVTGMLCAHPTPHAIAEGLLKLLSDPTRARAMGNAARAHAAKHFTWDNVAEQIGRVVKGSSVAATAPVAPLPAGAL